MDVEKQVTIRIDIPNPSSVVDIDGFCMEFLNTYYKGKCYSDCFIYEIKKIIYRSKCIIHTTAPSYLGFVDVRFILAGKKYAEGSIISNAEILNIDMEGNIFLKKNNINMVVKAKSVNIFGLTKGHKINVRVLRESHPAFSSTITCLGELYFYPTDNEYNIVGGLSREEEHIVIGKIEKISKIKEKIKEIPSAIYEYFYNLTYPFKTPPPKGGVSILDYAKLKGSIKMGKNHPASEFVEVGTNSAAPSSSKFTILIKMLNNYEQNLSCLIDMCVMFEKDREKNSAVWKIYNTQKK